MKTYSAASTDLEGHIQRMRDAHHSELEGVTVSALFVFDDESSEFLLKHQGRRSRCGRRPAPSHARDAAALASARTNNHATNRRTTHVGACAECVALSFPQPTQQSVCKREILPMNYQHTGLAAAAGQDLSQLTRHLPAITRPPSLEQRLDYLRRALERLQKVRAHLGSIAERASVDPTGTGASHAAVPESTDLSGRFGDAIGYVHANLDEIERLCVRLEAALYDPEKGTAEVRRA
jgi:hypothetical protein